VSEIVSEPVPIFHDDFDQLSSSNWRWSGDDVVTVSDGTLQVVGTPDWFTWVSRPQDLDEGSAALVLFKISGTEPDFVLYFGNGEEWATEEYRRWGIADDYGFRANIYQGASRVGLGYPVGDLVQRPDTWYYLLIANGRGGLLVTQIWEHDSYSTKGEYRWINQDWEGVPWSFHIAAGGGTIVVESYTEITFSGLQPLPPAAVHFWTGQTLYDVGDYEQALAEYDQAIERDPEQAIYYSRRGSCYTRLGDENAAVNDKLRAVEVDPSFWQAHLGLASRYLYVFEDYEAVIYHATKVIELAPDYPSGYRYRGLAHRDLGNNQQAAIADFTMIIEMEPDEANHYRERCIAYNNAGEHTAALQDCTQCIDLNPEHDGCYFDRGWAYNSLGDTAAAVADYEMYLQLVAPDVCPECQEAAQAYIDEHGQ
jgi:tetratricopeptide (TPR) repeat protein